MSAIPSETTQVQAQYAAQVAADLDANLKERERIRSEVAALQDQLQVLESDHALLVSMQQALSSAAPVNGAATKATSAKKAPAATKPRAAKTDAKTNGKAGTKAETKADAKTDAKADAKSDLSTTAAKTVAKGGANTGTKKAGSPAATKKSGAATKKAAAKSKTAPKVPAARSAGPTLVDLIREHLGAQHEPRSAAEIASALAKAHPERTIKATVVRTTVEGLVAKAQAQRNKQGSSVYYTAAAAPQAQLPSQQQPETSDA
ncbi:hypothetical protein [Streptomyces sp. NPDC002564]|uniref:hypothetical protein n=1 Tax=Streptomyces sp. NPDC002564 TaxID=3364649 RepID=UPI00368C7CEC